MSEPEIDEAIDRMEFLGRDKSAWCALYRSPGTQILFELCYPHSEMHGGGPRELRPISQQEAASKYGTTELHAEN